jgi:CheY-like chemotaxis protein
MRKVLIVDDSPIACRLIQIELSPFGYDVLAVESVDEAIALLDRHRDVCTVMLDLSVAEMLGGSQVLERLRATRPDRHLPVILHSALADKELAQRRSLLGAEGAFRKGGRLVDLVKQLKTLEV